MKTIITAHSGSDNTPDNSLEFVRYALTTDVEALELDVRKSADGRFVLSHDESSDACPTLQEAFALLKNSDKLLNCDLKDPDTELAVLGLAESCGVADHILFSGDVSPALVRDNSEIRRRTLFNLWPFAEDMLRRFDRGEEPTTEDLEHIAQQCRQYRVSVINIPYGLCTDRFLRFFREKGIGISAWTVGEESVARTLFAADIVNITTRSPRKFCALRNELLNR